MQAVLLLITLTTSLALGLTGAARRSALARWGGLAVALLCFAATLAVDRMNSAHGADKSPAKARPEGEPRVKKLVKPNDWPPGHPLPLVGSNCAACHLTAGRELTAAVTNFVRSAHDLNEMTCYDCHGGNTRDDVRAHESAFGFIGTKKSAHIANCSSCHDEAADVLASGPHHWDFSKRINTEYPMCFDCHGNHDVGNPPADFKLAAMCGDCHEKLDKDFPNIAAVVKENDRLWDVLRKVRKRNILEKDPIPARFSDRAAELRTATMRVIHGAKEISSAEAKELNGQAELLREGLGKWLQSKP